VSASSSPPFFFLSLKHGAGRREPCFLFSPAEDYTEFQSGLPGFFPSLSLPRITAMAFVLECFSFSPPCRAESRMKLYVHVVFFLFLSFFPFFRLPRYAAKLLPSSPPPPSEEAVHRPAVLFPSLLFPPFPPHIWDGSGEVLPRKLPFPPLFFKVARFRYSIGSDTRILFFPPPPQTAIYKSRSEPFLPFPPPAAFEILMLDEWSTAFFSPLSSLDGKKLK